MERWCYTKEMTVKEYEVLFVTTAVLSTVTIMLSLSHVWVLMFGSPNGVPKHSSNLRTSLTAIVFVVPVITLLYVLEAITLPAYQFFDLVRVCYESYALFRFFDLMVALLGGPNQAVHTLSRYGEPARIYAAFPMCLFIYCMEPTILTRKAMTRIRWGALQICFVRPILALLLIIFTVGMLCHLVLSKCRNKD